MKNAKTILESIVNKLPAQHRKLAREVLEARYLAQRTAHETADYLGISYKTVVSILREVQDITRGKNPMDFA